MFLKNHTKREGAGSPPDLARGGGLNLRPAYAPERKETRIWEEMGIGSSSLSSSSWSS